MTEIILCLKNIINMKEFWLCLVICLAIIFSILEISLTNTSIELFIKSVILKSFQTILLITVALFISDFFICDIGETMFFVKVIIVISTINIFLYLIFGLAYDNELNKKVNFIDDFDSFKNIINE